MNRITIAPESEQHWLDLRTQDLTSTDVAALFGLSHGLLSRWQWRAA